MTFITIIEYVFSPYPVYPECILDVSCWDPNFGLIEHFFMGNMGFFGMRSSFLTFFYTFEQVFSPFPVYPVCILGVFWMYSVGIPIFVQQSSNLWLIWFFSVHILDQKISLYSWLENQLILACLIGQKIACIFGWKKI